MTYLCEQGVLVCECDHVFLSLTLSLSHSLSIPFLISNVFTIDHYVSILVELCIIPIAMQKTLLQ